MGGTRDRSRAAPGSGEDPEGSGGSRRLGVLGTLVRDTIHADDGRAEPVEEWGGIAYSLSAFEAAGPPGWRLVPMIKVGRDLREEVSDLLRSFRRLHSLDGIRVVPEPNNRVELDYRSPSGRSERLRGGVPGWQWTELAPLVAICDAVYVNFIAGWELDLETARGLARGFGGPLYADLHSLLLGVGPDGVRYPRPLEEGKEWVRCFDFVQVNQEELKTLAAGCGEEPWDFAVSVVGPETRAVFVTQGERGAAWVAAEDFRPDGPEGDPGSLEVLPGERARVGRCPAVRKVSGSDPTGCGDSWGITCFGALLQGFDPAEAVRRANEVAARNAALRGATALARHEGDGDPARRAGRPGAGG